MCSRTSCEPSILVWIYRFDFPPARLLVQESLQEVTVQLLIAELLSSHGTTLKARSSAVSTKNR